MLIKKKGKVDPQRNTAKNRALEPSYGSSLSLLRAEFPARLAMSARARMQCH